MLRGLTRFGRVDIMRARWYTLVDVAIGMSMFRAPKRLACGITSTLRLGQIGSIGGVLHAVVNGVVDPCERRLVSTVMREIVGRQVQAAPHNPCAGNALGRLRCSRVLNRLGGQFISTAGLVDSR